MSYGLQVFDANGGVMVDVVDRLTRIHSVYSVTVPANTSTLYLVAGMTNDGTWAAFVNSIGMFATVSVEVGGLDRKSTRLNSSHLKLSRMPSSA